MSDPQHVEVLESPSDGSPAGREGVRLELKPGTSRSGYVDGGWWPRSRDLRAEIPELLMAMSERFGPVERVAYNPAGWDATTRGRLVTATGRVALEAFDTFAPTTIWVSTRRAAQTPFVLAVIPADTADADANAGLHRASTAGNTDRPGDLVARAA